jgi:hypothetical protein
MLNRGKIKNDVMTVFCGLYGGETFLKNNQVLSLDETQTNSNLLISELYFVIEK